MKKVSGPLKLELAAYREFEAFAQFGSDLDPTTKKALERGKRMMELLKQPVNSPIPFYKQAAVLFAATQGFVDSIDVSEVLAYEALLYQKLDSSHSELADLIKHDKKLTDEVKAGLKALAQEVLEEITN